MDPNETLRRMRAIVDGGPPYEDMDHEEVLADLAELVSAMDTWLSNGGFLPRDWER